MTREIAIMIMLFNVFLASVSQVILKKEANKQHKDKLSEILNLGVFIGYGLFFSITVINVLLYRYVEFNLILVIESFSYVSVLVLSYFAFKEKMTKRQLIGVFVILSGILLYII